MGLLWHKHLLYANEAQRQEYEFSTIGIHWSKQDEDVSFESFTYEEAEPSDFQHFFLEHPEINVAEFAKGIGLNPSLFEITSMVSKSHRRKGKNRFLTVFMNYGEFI